MLNNVGIIMKNVLSYEYFFFNKTLIFSHSSIFSQRLNFFPSFHFLSDEKKNKM